MCSGGAIVLLLQCPSFICSEIELIAAANTDALMRSDGLWVIIAVVAAAVTNAKTINNYV